MILRSGSTRACQTLNQTQAAAARAGGQGTCDERGPGAQPKPTSESTPPTNYKPHTVVTVRSGQVRSGILLGQRKKLGREMAEGVWGP